MLRVVSLQEGHLGHLRHGGFGPCRLRVLRFLRSRLGVRDGLLDALDDGGKCLVELLPCIFCCLLYPFHPISNILKAFNLTARSLLNRFVYALLVKLNSRFMGSVYVSSETRERYALSLS
ncbi:Uncharacterised protein [Mycobacterium tuberculosis]|nr:Uncharacterised protein [Mycobacterium tuberculosis]